MTSNSSAFKADIAALSFCYRHNNTLLNDVELQRNAADLRHHAQTAPPLALSLRAISRVRPLPSPQP